MVACYFIDASRSTSFEACQDTDAAGVVGAAGCGRVAVQHLQITAQLQYRTAAPGSTAVPQQAVHLHGPPTLVCQDESEGLIGVVHLHVHVFAFKAVIVC